jgi:hypothetical protein
VVLAGAGSDALNDAFSRAPPTLSLASLRGDVTVTDPFGGLSTLRLASAPRGNLELLARGDVRLPISGIVMDDVDPVYARGPLVPFTTTIAAGQVEKIVADPGAAPDAATNGQRGFVPIHAGDPAPAVVQALEGSVCAQTSGACVLDGSLSTRIDLPKPLQVFAGKDIVAGYFTPQNDGPADVSILAAGRDVLEPNLLVGGEGAAVVQAGRSVVLDQYSNNPTRGGNVYALGNRLDTKGTQLNLALPATRGADLYVVAGLANGADYDGFASVYLDPANRAGVARTYLPELGTFLRKLGISATSDAERLAAFHALPRIQQEIFLDGIYLVELRQTGIEHNDPSSPAYQSYQRGYAAVTRLFPTDPASVSASARGDVILNSKPLETQADAGITVLAPYGAVEVGSSVQLPGNDPTRSGVVTRRGGAIEIMSDGNVDLFTSRVFTLQGGDILMWTSDGSITAGAGAKTSVFQAPLQYQIDSTATITVDSFGLQTGAGIGVLDALGNGVTRPRSRLDLIAPRGEVNAGDAGIRVAGDLNIAAAAVVGIENIQVSGASQGVPKVEAPNLGALTTASQVAQAAAREGVGPESAAARSAVADLPSIITVEVVGYETSDPGDERKKDEKKRSAPPAR